MIKPYPVIKRAAYEPSSKFRAWVAQYGPIRLARSLGISRSAVHAWVTTHGQRRRPRLETAYDIIALSRIEPLRGEEILTLADVVGDVKIKHLETRPRETEEACKST